MDNTHTHSFDSVPDSFTLTYRSEGWATENRCKCSCGYFTVYGNGATNAPTWHDADGNVIEFGTP